MPKIFFCKLINRLFNTFFCYINFDFHLLSFISEWILLKMHLPGACQFYNWKQLKVVILSVKFHSLIDLCFFLNETWTWIVFNSVLKFSMQFMCVKWYQEIKLLWQKYNIMPITCGKICRNLPCISISFGSSLKWMILRVYNFTTLIPTSLEKL